MHRVEHRREQSRAHHRGAHSVNGGVCRRLARSPDFLRPLHHEDGNDNSGEAVVGHEHEDVADRRQDGGDNPSDLNVGQVKVPVVVRADVRWLLAQQGGEEVGEGHEDFGLVGSIASHDALAPGIHVEV